MLSPGAARTTTTSPPSSGTNYADRVSLLQNAGLFVGQLDHGHLPQGMIPDPGPRESARHDAGDAHLGGGQGLPLLRIAVPGRCHRDAVAKMLPGRFLRCRNMLVLFALRKAGDLGFRT